MSTPVKVKKWGGSLAVRIPRQFAKTRGIEAGSIIDLEAARPLNQKRRRYKLSDLLAGYRSRHRHGEWNIGKPVGREVW